MRATENGKESKQKHKNVEQIVEFVQFKKDERFGRRSCQL